MKPRLIKTEADHAEALARLEEIFAAQPGTPEGDEFELLAHLVEQFERGAFPIGRPTPVEAIKFRMEQQGLKNKDLVPYLGSPSKVSEVLAGQRRLSLTMIRNLVTGLGLPAEVLIGEPGTDRRPDREVPELHKYPLGEMLKRGWFDGFRGSVAEAKRQLEGLFDTFAGPLGTQALRPAFHRQHVRHGGRRDDYALAAWRIRVLTRAAKAALPAYDPGTLTPEFFTRLAQLSYLDAGPRLAGEFLNKNGLHLIVEPHLPRTHLDGAAMILPDGSPVVALTLRYDRLDHFWFTLFHELAHVALHLAQEDFEVYFDDLDDRRRDRCEEEADAFAQDALIPARQWKASGLSRHAPPDAVLRFANQLHISPAIPAGRVRHERKNFFILKSLVGQGRVRGLFEVARH